MWKLAGLGVVTVSLAATAAGCSDDDPALTAPVDPQQCGATVASMNGEACTQEGRACSVPIECAGGEKQTSICTCDGKTFSCIGTDAKTPVEGKDEPTCVDIPVDPEIVCGDSPDALNGTSCPTLRRSCRFASVACEGDFNGGYDTCDCAQVGTEQHWVCSKASCGDGGTFEPPDTGTSSSSSSGGTDAGDAGSGEEN
jgi:hypothetical protein